MKHLTKDDFKIDNASGFIECNSWNMKEILKNQEIALSDWAKWKEEAEKWRVGDSIELCVELKRIVERLKKFSPEIIHKAECLDDYHTGKAIKELVQKILEGKK